MSRKPTILDSDKVMQTAIWGASLDEIAAFFDCSVSLLSKKYIKAIQKGREIRKLSLRRMQWKAAESGNISMQIWLGKQELGQRENSVRQLEANGIEKPLPWED